MKHALCRENIRGDKTEDEEGSENVKLNSALMGVCSSIECICIMVVSHYTKLNVLGVTSVLWLYLYILCATQPSLTRLAGVHSRFH